MALGLGEAAGVDGALRGGSGVDVDGDFEGGVEGAEDADR